MRFKNIDWKPLNCCCSTGRTPTSRAVIMTTHCKPQLLKVSARTSQSPVIYLRQDVNRRVASDSEVVFHVVESDYLVL